MATTASWWPLRPSRAMVPYHCQYFVLPNHQVIYIPLFLLWDFDTCVLCFSAWFTWRTQDHFTKRFICDNFMATSKTEFCTHHWLYSLHKVLLLITRFRGQHTCIIYHFIDINSMAEMKYRRIKSILKVLTNITSLMTSSRPCITSFGLWPIRYWAKAMPRPYSDIGWPSHAQGILVRYYNAARRGRPATLQ